VHGSHTVQLVLPSVGAQQNYGSVSSTMETSVEWFGFKSRPGIWLSSPYLAVTHHSYPGKYASTASFHILIR